MDSHDKTEIFCRNFAKTPKISFFRNIKHLSKDLALSHYKLRWFYDLPRMHYTILTAY